MICSQISDDEDSHLFFISPFTVVLFFTSLCSDSPFSPLHLHFPPLTPRYLGTDTNKPCQGQQTHDACVFLISLALLSAECPAVPTETAVSPGQSVPALAIQGEGAAAWLPLIPKVCGLSLSCDAFTSLALLSCSVCYRLVGTSGL